MRKFLLALNMLAVFGGFTVCMYYTVMHRSYPWYVLGMVTLFSMHPLLWWWEHA